MLSDLMKDLRFGLRGMKKNPTFSFVAVLTIAIGIGVNVVVFTLVQRILLSSLPYPEPDRLVWFVQAYPDVGLDQWGLSPANFVRYRDQNKTLEAVAAYTTNGTILLGGDTPEFIRAGKVTADFFKVFGVSPLLGRTFGPDEDTPGKNNVVVLSYALWQRRFGGDPQVVGRSLVAGDVPCQVIGVMPSSFRFPSSEVDLWTPLALNSEALHPFAFAGVARLKEGLTMATAVADTSTVLRNFAAENPALIGADSAPPPGAGLKTLFTPLKERIVGDIERPLLILQIAVALVLLIACANVANLLLSRATKRTQEISMRLALGASPGRIIRQLLTESILLATIGAVIGTLFAVWIVRMFSQASGRGIPRIEETGISLTVLGVTVLLTLVTGLLFGLVPALRAYKFGVRGGSNEGQRGSSVNRRMNSTLVVVQLALSLVLLIGAGLVLKSFQRLMSVNPGFETDRALTMMVPVSSKKYPKKAEGLEFYRRLLDEVRSLPGVNSAALASNIPFSGRGGGDGFVLEGLDLQGEKPQAEIKVVSPGYFKTMGIPLLQGRDFQTSDDAKAPLVAIVDQKLARQYWSGGDIIGKRIRTSDPEWYTIVGVATSVKADSLAEEGDPHLYLLSQQMGFAYGQSRDQRGYYLVVNTDSPAGIVPTIRERVRTLDPDVPLYAVNTMTQVINQSVDSQRLINLLLTSFSVVALLLAAIGTYGVMSVFVTSRKQEFAIRLALGAQPRNLLTSVLKQALVLAAIGIVFGLLGSWALTRTLSSQLFEVSATDPIVFTIIPIVLTLVTLLASLFPAVRAARTNPAVVLRDS